MEENNKEKAAQAACEEKESAQQPAEQDEPQQPEESRGDGLEKQLQELDERYRRMLAEYDNFRKRSAKEREGIFADSFASTVALFLDRKSVV